MMKPIYMNHVYGCSRALLMIVCMLSCIICPVYATDMIIIVPYNPGGNLTQKDEQWVAVAEQFQTYKESIGLETQVFTLEFINDAYGATGVDEPERIKRLIYNKVRFDDVRYVMLVGDAGIFPIRYQYTGYSSAGHTLWHRKEEEPWYEYPAYGFFPCDAYYANLWDNNDASMTFETWDADGDGFYGELYKDNYRGTDGNTIHPDVALGRVPCKNPDEFFRYMLKVMAYESHAPRHDKNALFIGGGFSTSRQTKLDIGDSMDSLYAIAYLLGEEGRQWDFTKDGRTTDDVNPHDTIINHTNDALPQFINYAGHGEPKSLWEPGFYRSDVSALTNFWQPAIVMAPGSCSTARYARRDTAIMPYSIPVTSAPNGDSMAEAFLTDYTDGGVIYIGSILSMQPPGLYLDKRLFRAVEDGVAAVGDCFRQAIDDFIEEYDLDTANRSEWQAISDWPDDEGGRWYWYPPAEFHTVYKVQIFGDPSLRINRVIDEVISPQTTAFYNRWVNRQHLSDYRDTYFDLDVELEVHDDAGIPIRSTRYNYDLDGNRSQWRDGTSFSVPIYMNPSLEGNDGYEILYYSTNELGHAELFQHGDISFDFTAPHSEIGSVYGDDDPLVIDGVLAFDVDSMRIEATDNLSGVARIDYRFSAESSYRSTYNDSATIRFPCFVMSDLEFSHRAADDAGNTETWSSTFLRFPSCADYLELRARFADMLSAEAGRFLFDFPPKAVDGVVNIGFESDRKPSLVKFEASGPFHEEYLDHDWEPIGEAFYNVKTERWELDWDTGKVGVENGFFWVRARPEYALAAFQEILQEDEPAPRLIWINNMKNKNPDIEILSIVSDKEKVWPGDTIIVTAVFHYDMLEEVPLVTMRLMLDEAFFQDLKEEVLLYNLDSLKKDQKVSFKVTLKDENLPTLDHISFKVAMTGKGIPLLTSDYLKLSLNKRRVSVKGTVKDTKGDPVSADVEMINKTGTETESTLADGSFHFEDVVAGIYRMTLATIPDGYWPVNPRDEFITVRIDGEDIEQHFMMAGEDHQAPAFAHLSTYEKVAATDVVNGMICDRNFGSGVSGITVTLKDERTNHFLDVNGNWQNSDTRIPVYDIEPCPSSQPVYDSGDTPLKANLPVDTLCVTFHLDLPDHADLETGRKLIIVRAEDKAGNEAGHEIRRTIVHPAFTADKTSGPAPLTVNFTNRSTGSIDFHHWDFGDGKSDESPSVAHTYIDPGVYDVRLIVSGMDTSDEEIKKEYITVLEEEPSSQDKNDGGGGCFASTMIK